MNYTDLVYFDIETAGEYPDLESFKESDIRGYDLFMRKLDRKSDQFTDWKEDPNIVYINKSPLMPEFGKIVCVSISFFSNGEQKISSIYNETEDVIIKRVHQIFGKISNQTLLGLCGFFIKGFDIPWINRKMLKYGYHIPKVLKTFNVKPWEMNVVDLAEVWRCSGMLESTSFDEMLFALDIESPKSIMAGKDVHNNYWNNEIEKIKTYCEADVNACVEASKKIIHLL